MLHFRRPVPDQICAIGTSVSCVFVAAPCGQELVCNAGVMNCEMNNLKEMDSKKERRMKSTKWWLNTSLLAASIVLPAQAGTFSNNFDTGALPPGTATNSNTTGGAFLETTGGVGNSGCLKLTKNINSENGSFIIDDLDAGSPIYGFDVTFKLR